MLIGFITAPRIQLEQQREFKEWKFANLSELIKFIMQGSQQLQSLISFKASNHNWNIPHLSTNSARESKRIGEILKSHTCTQINLKRCLYLHYYHLKWKLKNRRKRSVRMSTIEGNFKTIQHTHIDTSYTQLTR